MVQCEGIVSLAMPCFLIIIHFHFQVYVQAIDTVTMEMTQEFITTAIGSNKPYHIFVQLGNIELIQGKV